MEIKSQIMKHCTLIAVSGRVDSSTAHALDEALQNLIRSGSKNLVLGLAEVPFISSAGLRALISAHIALRRQLPAGSVVLAECSPDLKATFELVGFHHQFKFYEHALEAVGSF